MHHRLIILTDVYTWKDTKGEAKSVRTEKRFKTSLDVRKATKESLVEEGFCDQKRFSSAPADWFSIGGRWSGCLTEALLNQLLWKSCLEKLRENADKIGLNMFYSRLTKAKRTKGEEIFKSFFPKFKGLMPVYRDEYEGNGYEDDAMIVTKGLWNGMIRDLVEKSSDDYYEDPLIYLEGSIDEVNSKNSIGLKWAVVVDYHS